MAYPLLSNPKKSKEIRRSQSATEYMIILAVVIIIALVVVGALGNIPGMGNSARIRASAAFWQDADVAITAYAMTSTPGAEHVLKVRNNLRTAITIRNISLSLTGSSSPQLFSREPNLSLGPGEEETVYNNTAFSICGAVGNNFASNVNISYLDDETGGRYPFTGMGNKLEGTCAQ